MPNEVKVTVTWEDSSGGTAAAGARKTGQAIGQAAQSAKRDLGQAEQASTGFGGALRRMGEIAGGITIADTLQNIGQKAKQFLGDSKQAAMDLEQSVGGVDQVFGRSAGEIHKWGARSAESFGLSRNAFNESVVPLGAMLKNTGMSMQDVTKNTIDLTGRAADMAATFGGETKDALAAIQAGLRGELDPLEQYGVKLSAASVEQKALAMTGKTAASSLTEQEKATARLAVIMEQTSGTQGQFAREADTAAGAQQRAKAATEDFKASLGNALLPVTSLASHALVDLVSAFDSLPGPAKAIVGSVILLGSAAASVAPTLMMMGGAMGQMGASAGGVMGKLKSVGSFLIGPWGLAIGAGVAVLTAFGMRSSEAAEKQREFADAGRAVGEEIAKQNGVLNENVRQAAAKAIQDKDLDQKGKILGLTTRDLTDALLGEGNMREEVARRAKAYLEQKEASGDLTSEEAGAVAELVNGLGAEIDGKKKGEKASKDYADATETSASALEDEKAAAEAALEAIQKKTDAAIAGSNAEIGYQQAVDDANESVKENGRTLDTNTEKGRNNRKALNDLAGSSNAYVRQLKAQGASTGQVITATNNARAQFIRVATQMGLTRAQASRLATQYGLIPRSVVTRVELRAEAARVNAAAYRRALDNIPRTITTTSVFVRAQGGPGKQFLETGGVTSSAQTGGARHGSTLVNEAGPEVIDVPNGSKVMTAGATRALAEAGAFRGGNGDPVIVQPHFTVELSIGGRRIDEMIEAKITETDRRTKRAVSSGRGNAR